VITGLSLPKTVRSIAKYQQVEIYRPNQPVETVLFSTPLSGENILPGFVLDLKNIFET
jgi:Uma2 family endonuclease